jgi:hypothetical protein
LPLAEPVCCLPFTATVHVCRHRFAVTVLPSPFAVTVCRHRLPSPFAVTVCSESFTVSVNVNGRGERQTASGPGQQLTVSANGLRTTANAIAS